MNSMNVDQTHQNTYSEAETAARREATLTRMFATPHKQQRPSKGKRVESQGK